MSKEVRIPISSVDKFVTDGTYVGVAFRYRLKNPNDATQTSQWSPTNLLKFTPYYDSVGSFYGIARTNLSGIVTSTIPASLHSSFNLNATSTDITLPQSEILQLTSNKENGSHLPEKDSYICKWDNPEDSNVKNFDVYTSWNMWSFLAKSATLGVPSGTGPYTGTLRLDGNDGINSALSFKTYLDVVGASAVNIYAGPGTTTPGNTFTIRTDVNPYTVAGTTFNIQSASTWSTTGTVTNVTRTHAWTEYEYVGTTPDKTSEISFNRKMKTSNLTATITQGGSTIKVDAKLLDPVTEDYDNTLLKYGVMPGMSVTKVSGEGEFSGGIISQVDYRNNIIVLSASQDSVSTITQTFTIGTVTTSSGISSANITSGTAFTTNLEVGQLITGVSSGSAPIGSLGIGAVRIKSINSATSITVESVKSMTAGNLVSISYPTKLTTGHTKSGQITFVANNEDLSSTTGGGIGIAQYWQKPMFVQAIIYAATNGKAVLDDASNNIYTTWSITPTRSTYFDGYATISTADTTFPYSVTLTNMSMPYHNADRSIGLRLYSEKNIGVVLPPTATAADYLTGTSLVVTASSQIPTGGSGGTVVSLRL